MAISRFTLPLLLTAAQQGHGLIGWLGSAPHNIICSRTPPALNRGTLPVMKSSYDSSLPNKLIDDIPDSSTLRLPQALSVLMVALLISLPQNPFVTPARALTMAQVATTQVATIGTPTGSSECSLPTISTTADTTLSVATKAHVPSRRYINLTGFPFPLGPFTERKTVETVLVPNRVYSFEQEQKLSGITANVRSTVFRMRDNRLLVYNPVAPTEEFLSQLNALDHSGVAHILLGATAYEHKIFVGPFARKFPNAKVWAAPDQWSFPLDLPAPLLGINTKGSGGGELLDSESGSGAYASAPDLTEEFEIKLLRPPKRLGFGYAANEVALLHRDTKTLALTDALLHVPSSATAIYDTANLLDVGDNGRGTNSLGNIILKAAGAVNWRGTAARDVEALWASAEASAERDAQGENAVLQRGWERNTLLSLYFGPAPSSLVNPKPSFEQLRDRWIVAPVTDSLIYRSDRVKPELSRWVNDLARWDFDLIVPSHFAAAPGTADDLRAAFAPTLRPEPRLGRAPYDTEDVRLLDDIAAQLVKFRII